MPPSKDYTAKHSFSRSNSNGGTYMSAKVYHPATNLLPPSPPQSPTGVAPTFPNRPSGNWSRQNSQNNGK
ncbi:unnamed protein product, partial [Brenthis ino]